MGCTICYYIYHEAGLDFTVAGPLYQLNDYAKRTELNRTPNA